MKTQKEFIDFIESVLKETGEYRIEKFEWSDGTPWLRISIHGEPDIRIVAEDA